jgi:hypothetical protein
VAVSSKVMGCGLVAGGKPSKTSKLALIICFTGIILPTIDNYLYAGLFVYKILQIALVFFAPTL